MNAPALHELAALRLRGARVPVVGLCAHSGSGKTTLARQVIGLLNAGGLRVGVIKQARDDFDVDRPDKDSARLRAAGIDRLLLGSERQAALIDERGGEHALEDLFAAFDQERLDLILVEGFADAALPKLEIRRAGATGRPPRYPHDPWVIAVASDLDELTPPPPPRIVRLDLNDPWAVAEFIVARFCTADAAAVAD